MSLRRATWSGSAVVGGILADHFDFRFAFRITAFVPAAEPAVLVVFGFSSQNAIFGKESGHNQAGLNGLLVVWVSTPGLKTHLWGGR